MQTIFDYISSAKFDPFYKRAPRKPDIPFLKIAWYDWTEEKCDEVKEYNRKVMEEYKVKYNRYLELLQEDFLEEMREIYGVDLDGNILFTIDDEIYSP